MANSCTSRVVWKRVEVIFHINSTPTKTLFRGCFFHGEIYERSKIVGKGKYGENLLTILCDHTLGPDNKKLLIKNHWIIIKIIDFSLYNCTKRTATNLIFSIMCTQWNVTLENISFNCRFFQIKMNEVCDKRSKNSIQFSLKNIKSYQNFDRKNLRLFIVWLFRQKTFQLTTSWCGKFSNYYVCPPVNEKDEDFYFLSVKLLPRAYCLLLFSNKLLCL